MIWLRLLMACRPCWQFAVLLLYAYSAHQNWQQAAIAVMGAIYIVTNALLAMLIEHPRWQEVRRLTVFVEGVATLGIAVVMIGQWPLGPVSLLLLPTLVTYAWLFTRDSWQWLVVVAMGGVYLASLRSGLIAQPATDSSNTASYYPQLVMALYAAILGFGTLLAFLLQLQRAESTRLYQAMGQVEDQSKQLARVNEQMNTYTDRIYTLATAEERNRIAGEIHDTVAHRLTALLVQLQAARRLLESEDAATAAANLEVCEALSRESLDEVRRSVRAIRRDSGMEGLEVLRRLTVHYASLTGMDIHLSIAAEVGTLPAQMVALLYRVLQESLTNAQRHGRATRVDVSLSQSGAHLQLEVTDNGKGAAAHEPGFGLSSMMERIRQYGGDVRTFSLPGTGFRLTLTLPMWEGVGT